MCVSTACRGTYPWCGRGRPAPAASNRFAAYDNIPVLSWLILRGRCRNCKTPISPRYLIVELLTGAIFLACYAHFGATLATLKYCAFGFLLLGLIFTDAETQLLPDKMTLPGLALGLVFSLVVPVNDLASQLLPGLVSLPVSSDVSWHLLSLVDAVLGAIVGASFIYGAGAIYLRARGVEGMGFGDVKLMAMVGAFLGAKLTIFTLFSASIAGSLFGVSTVLAVWIKRTRRRMARNHEPAARGAAPRLGIGRDRAAPPSNAFWRLSRQHGHGRASSTATASCTGTGGCCETGDQSHRAAHGAGVRGRRLCLYCGAAPDAAYAPQHQ